MTRAENMVDDEEVSASEAGAGTAVTLSDSEEVLSPAGDAQDLSMELSSFTAEALACKPQLSHLWAKVKKYWEEETKLGMTDWNRSRSDGRIVYASLPQRGSSSHDHYSMVATFPDIGAYKFWARNTASAWSSSRNAVDCAGSARLPSYEETKMRNLISEVTHPSQSTLRSLDSLCPARANTQPLSKCFVLEQRGMCDRLSIEVRYAGHDAQHDEPLASHNDLSSRAVLPSYGESRIEDVIMKTIFPSGHLQYRRNMEGSMVQVSLPFKRLHRIRRRGSVLTLIIEVHYE